MTSSVDRDSVVGTGSIPATGLPFPVTEYQRRAQSVIGKFDAFGIDALVATSNASQHYLTGYDGSGDYFAPFPVILTPDGTATYVVRRYDEDAVRAQSWVEDVVTYTHQHEFAKVLAETMRARGLSEATLGLELGSWNLSPADLEGLRSELPGIEIVDATRLVPSVAVIKSTAEIEAMRASMALTDIAVRTFHEFIRPGATEFEAAAAVEHAVRAAGGIPRIVSLLFGGRTALPHGTPTAFALEPNQPAFTELGGIKNGYAAGLCRTAILGSHPEAERLHDVAAAALTGAIGAIRPGARMGDPDAEARRVLADAGRSETFLHRAGYQNGLGWSYRGNLSLEPDATDVIEPGMTFHLPMILFERGRFCVGVSQTVLVTDSGAEPLSATPPELYGAS